jgi:signal transduction histidine kinase
VSVKRGRELLPWVAAATLGVVAEWVGFGWGDPRHWIPDLLTGWTLLACGLLARGRRQGSRVGSLLAAVGAFWFAGNFASVRWHALAFVAAHLAFFHRGLLVHALLSYPSGRLRSRWLIVVVAAGYAASLVLVLNTSDVATIVAGLVLIAVALVARPPARVATVLLGAVLAGGAALRLADPGGGVDEAALLGYEAAVCVIALELLSGLRGRSHEEAAVADLVVELGERPSGPLRDALANTLGDPTLEIVYGGDSGSLIDAAGRAVPMPTQGPGRTVTLIERGGQRVAAVVHDPAVLEDPAMVDAITAAARLEAANSRLRADVQAQLAELAASRTRLLAARDDERQRLATRLHDGAEHRLLILSSILREARERAAGDATVEHVERAQVQLERTLADLHELARGLHPRVLVEEGLLGGIRDLAATCPVAVDLDVAHVRMAARSEAAAYFLCAEALANVVKHAHASRVSVTGRQRDGAYVVMVCDDGAGGAAPDAGSGLRGLADRVEAVGGDLRIESPPGGGTVLAAELPLGGEET